MQHTDQIQALSEFLLEYATTLMGAGVHTNRAVRNMIRESKAHQLDNVISSSAADGMISMDQSLLQLVKAGRIGADAALGHCVNSEWLRKRLALNA